MEDATGVMAKSEKAFATKNGWYLWCRMYDMKMTATDTEACPGSRRAHNNKGATAASLRPVLHMQLVPELCVRRAAGCAPARR